MPADPKHVESIFHRALELPLADRGSFLGIECGDDAELRGRVDRLLAAHDELGEPGRTSTEDVPGSQPQRDVHTPQPDAGVILSGKYKLIEEIGEGGMGTVWMAQQMEPVRRFVAVKLIKAGMDSRAVLARFEAERQALALMDHPNIAKVLDAGAAPDGRPFFVMELVKGVPITKFCDERKLTPRQRLELFVPVCQAIQHAHQKGVIHRDIKPSNVLVALYDDRPVPKVIDFGVAKAAGQQLTEKTLATGFGAVVGTPEYMSPEQASFNNLDIDTRSDVYALGVLLYELLVGSPPFSRKELEKVGLMEIFRVVREVEPPRPSTKLSTADALPSLSANRGTEPKRLTALLRGELDWIVMKALEKDRSRRYETANGFAADVQRYLAGESVQAVPPSAGYRLRKLLRKNRAAVLTAAGFAALVVGGAVTSTILAIQADRNADRAAANEAAANDARDDANRNSVLATSNANRAKEETERVRGMLYAANFGLIDDALRERRIGRVRHLLSETKPGPGETDLRGFEWHYVDRLVNSHKDIATLHHWDSWNEIPLATTPSLSRDGRWASMLNWGGVTGPGTIEDKKEDAFASQVGNNKLTVWDLTTGKVVSTIERRTAINYLCHQFIVSSGFVAFGSRRTVTIYDPATKSEKDSITVEGHLNRIRFDHTGRRMAVLTRIRDPKSPPGKPLYPIHHLWQVEVWDLARKERIQLIEREAGWFLHDIALSPDGSRLAIDLAIAVDNSRGEIPREVLKRNEVHKVVVWDLDGRKPAYELTAGNPSLPSSGAFSDDSRSLAVVRGRAVLLHDVLTGKHRRTYGPVDVDATAVAHSPDGRTLAVGDESAGITLFDVATGEELEQLLGHEQPITLLAFRGNETLVSNCKAGRVKEWSLGRSRHVIFTNLGPGPGGVDFDASYRHALTSRRVGPSPEGRVSSEVDLWDISSGQPRQLFRKPLLLSDPQLPTSLQPGSRFSPDGRRVVVTYIQTPRNRQYQIYPTPTSIGHLLPTPVDWFGGVTRASYGWASQIPGLARTVVWDVPSGEVVLDLPQLTSSPTFSESGRFLIMYHRHDDRINPTWADRRVWDLSVRPARCTTLEAPTIPLADQERIEQNLVFGPGDRYLTVIARKVRRTPPTPVTTGAYLLRWDLETGRLVFARPFPDPPAGLHVDERFIFSPDRTRILRLPNSEDGSPVLSGATVWYMWELRPDGEAVRIWTDSGEWMTGQDEGSRSNLTQLRAEFTPDGKRLVFVGERQARIYNLDAMDKPLILRGIRGFPVLAAFSDDGRRLVMLSNNAPINAPDVLEMKVWDLATGQELLAAPVIRMPQYDPFFVRTFDGKQLRMYARTLRGGEFITLDGSPREVKR